MANGGLAVGKARLGLFFALPLHPDGHHRLSVHSADIESDQPDLQGVEDFTFAENTSCHKSHSILRAVGADSGSYPQAEKDPLHCFFVGRFLYFRHSIDHVNAEADINPETGEYLFDSFFDAFYWAACTLTTVGYGDIYPISDVGRVISIISSMVGIAIIALPSGIVTAGYLDELKAPKEKE